MRYKAGFSLLEILVSLTIVGILALMVYPVYTSLVRQGYRAEAIQALLSIEMSQEQWRATNASYGTLANVYGGTSSTPSGRYDLAISGVSGSGYTVTATAVGDQANDTENGESCASMSLVMSNTVVSATPVKCW